MESPPQWGGLPRLAVSWYLHLNPEKIITDDLNHLFRPDRDAKTVHVTFASFDWSQPGIELNRQPSGEFLLFMGEYKHAGKIYFKVSLIPFCPSDFTMVI